MQKIISQHHFLSENPQILIKASPKVSEEGTSTCLTSTWHILEQLVDFKIVVCQLAFNLPMITALFKRTSLFYFSICELPCCFRNLMSQYNCRFGCTVLPEEM